MEFRGRLIFACQPTPCYSSIFSVVICFQFPSRGITCCCCCMRISLPNSISPIPFTLSPHSIPKFAARTSPATCDIEQQETSSFRSNGSELPSGGRMDVALVRRMGEKNKRDEIVPTCRPRVPPLGRRAAWSAA